MMRLSSEQREVIRKHLRERWENCRIWLFGSRADNSRKGGDIDLYCELSTENPTLREQLLLKVDLQEKLGIPVDLVVRNPSVPDKPIYQIAKKTGIEL